MSNFSGGTAAALTPPGRGAVATIRIDADLAAINRRAELCHLKTGRPLEERAEGEITFVQWGTEAPEDVVACRVSNTAWELHCHGGQAAVARILNDLQGAGVAIGALDHDKDERARLMELAWREVARATTLKTANLLLEQTEVAWPRLLESATIDAARILEWRSFGLHLTRPWKVALCGRPNAGKSSLMNALAGYARSIVHDRPGTTRDAITLDTALDGWPVQLVDTAGLRDAGDVIETEGIRRALEAAAGADLVLLVIDGSESPTEEARQLLAAFPMAIQVWNKSDLGNAWGSELPYDVIAVSARTGAGLKDLIARVVGRLIPREPPPGQAVPMCEEHVAWIERTLSR